MQLVIDACGLVHAVYDETIDLSLLGSPTIRRVSQVEPDASGQWWADLASVDGPSLGPFPRRSLALAAERTWLEQHLLNGTSRRP